MEHLDPPDEITWDERRLWFHEREAAHAEGGAGALCVSHELEGLELTAEQTCCRVV